MQNKSPIMQMYYGERGNNESIKTTQELRCLLQAVVEGEEQLRHKLAEFPELLGLYKKTNDQFMEMHSESVANYYAEGFRFGFLLALDIMEINT